MSMKNTQPYTLITRHPDEVKVLNDILAAHRMRKVTPDEIPLLRTFAANLFGFEPAPIDILTKVENWSKLSLLVRVIDEKITGFLAVIPLTRAGHKALRRGDLTAANVKKHWVAHPGEPLEAGLLWGMGGNTVKDQTSIVFSLLSIWSDMYPGMPTYSRAATRHGLRLMKRMGYHLVLAPKDQPELWGCDGFPTGNVMSKAEYSQSKKQVA